MINIKTMFKGMATERGKIHYCYIVKGATVDYKETLCKVNKTSNSIKAINYFAKVDCKSCLERMKQLHDYIRVAIWHSNGFFYKGSAGINMSPIWADGFGKNHINIDINLFPEDLIDKNNIKEFISDSKNYIPLIKFINQHRKTEINLKEKIWVMKTKFDIETDKRKLLEKKKQEVKEQVEEKTKETKVTLLPYMRRRMFRNSIFRTFRRGL